MQQHFRWPSAWMRRKEKKSDQTIFLRQKRQYVGCLLPFLLLFEWLVSFRSCFYTTNDMEKQKRTQLTRKLSLFSRWSFFFSSNSLSSHFVDPFLIASNLCTWGAKTLNMAKHNKTEKRQLNYCIWIACARYFHVTGLPVSMIHKTKCKPRRKRSRPNIDSRLINC